MKALRRINPNLLPLLLLAAGAVALTMAAGLMLYSAFMFYDDEGYMLTSIRNFVAHGHLYGVVFTQYGPFPYVLYSGLHLLGLPLTHDAGRAVTLLAWAGAATSLAWLVWRVTKHSACMLVTLAGVFVYLWIMISEPTHPGGLIELITALMAVFGCYALQRDRWTTWAAVTGAGCAILALTKINVGAFATLSGVAFLLLNARHDRVRRIAPWLVGAGLLALPFGLMHSLLGEPWVRAYALIFAFAAVPVAVTATRGATGQTGAKTWLAAVAAGSTVILIVLGVVFARGTTPLQLLDGVLLEPLRHPGRFSFSFTWPPAATVIAALSFGSLLFALYALRLSKPRRITIDTVIVALRIVTALGYATTLWQFPGISPDHWVFSYSVSTLWFFLWPLTGEDREAIAARTWLGLLFLGQWLHAYPVPGSQIAWGTLLAIPLVVIGTWEGAVWLAERHGRTFNFRRAQSIDLTLTMMVTGLAVLTGNELVKIGGRYLPSRPLMLKGATMVRLPDSATALYRVLVWNAEAHADMVFSLPGMFSLNLWSSLPTPTMANVTHWFSLLNGGQQQAIIDELKAHPRACVVVQSGHLKFLREHGLTASGPLYDYVMNEFEPAFTIDDFEFRVHRGRKIVPLSTAELFRETTSQPTRGALVRIKLLLPDDRAIGRIDLVQMDQPATPPITLDSSNTRVELTSLALDGQTRTSAAAASFPFHAGGLTDVALYLDSAILPRTVAPTMLVVRDVEGRELALVRWLP